MERRSINGQAGTKRNAYFRFRYELIVLLVAAAIDLAGLLVVRRL